MMASNVIDKTTIRADGTSDGHFWLQDFFVM
jgi:hypothetical protein